MVICPNCNKENIDEAVFCANCGSKLNKLIIQNFDGDYNAATKPEKQKRRIPRAIIIGIIIYLIVFLITFGILRYLSSDNNLKKSASQIADKTTVASGQRGNDDAYNSTIKKESNPQSSDKLPAEDSWTTYNVSSWAIAIDSSGNKLFGGEYGVKELLSNDIWATNDIYSGLSYVHAIAIDSLGNQWFGTESGISKLSPNGDWSSYDTANSGLANDFVHTITIDSLDNKWFGTNGGVSELSSNGKWTTYNTSNSGLAYNVVNAIVLDLSGNKWFGTSGGISELSIKGAWKNYKSNSHLEGDNIITAIAIDSLDNKWFGTTNGFGKLTSSGEWITYATWNSGLIHFVKSLAIDSLDNKWFGAWGDSDRDATYGGVICVTQDDNIVKYDTSNSELVNNSVNAVTIDSSGNKWFGTLDGVSKLSNSVIRQLHDESD